MTKTCETENMKKMVIESDILDKFKYSTSIDDLKIIISFSTACKSSDMLVSTKGEGCSNLRQNYQSKLVPSKFFKLFIFT